MDVSCFDDDNCQLWAGVGRCIAVPWGPAANLKLSNADQIDPLMDNDYPQYCAARFFHDVVSNQAPAVMSADAYWKDYGSSFAWQLTLAFVFVWGCAAAMSLAGRRLSMLSEFTATDSLLENAPTCSMSKTDTLSIDPCRRISVRMYMHVYRDVLTKMNTWLHGLIWLQSGFVWERMDWQ